MAKFDPSPPRQEHDPAFLLRTAEKARRAAENLTNGRDRSLLLEIARGCEAEADLRDARHPAAPPPCAGTEPGASQQGGTAG